MLHTAVFPVISWCSGCRAWTHDQLLSARTMQLRMSRRALQMWERDTETLDEFWPRSTRQVEGRRILQGSQVERSLAVFLGEISRPCRVTHDGVPGSSAVNPPPVARCLLARDFERIALASVRPRPAQVGARHAWPAGPQVGRNAPTRVLAPPSSCRPSSRRLDDSGRRPRRVERS